jgi:hypothetical protein
MSLRIRLVLNLRNPFFQVPHSFKPNGIVNRLIACQRCVCHDRAGKWNF